MTEVLTTDTYVQQLEEVENKDLKTSLQDLYDAGYVDFDENKIMIESNPEMSLDDVMACIDESKKDDEDDELVDLDDDEESDAVDGEYDEKDIEDMEKLVGDVEGQETDPENDDKEAKDETDDAIVSTGPSSKNIDASESDNSKKAVKPFEENKNPNIAEPTHADPNLYVVRKKPKRALPGAKPEKATEIQQRVG